MSQILDNKLGLIWVRYWTNRLLHVPRIQSYYDSLLGGKKRVYTVVLQTLLNFQFFFFNFFFLRVFCSIMYPYVHLKDKPNPKSSVWQCNQFQTSQRVAVIPRSKSLFRCAHCIQKWPFYNHMTESKILTFGILWKIHVSLLILKNLH